MTRLTATNATLTIGDVTMQIDQFPWPAASTGCLLADVETVDCAGCIGEITATFTVESFDSEGLLQFMAMIDAEQRGFEIRRRLGEFMAARGFLQITGRTNYKQMAEPLPVLELVEDDARQRLGKGKHHGNRLADRWGRQK